MCDGILPNINDKLKRYLCGAHTLSKLGHGPNPGLYEKIRAGILFRKNIHIIYKQIKSFFLNVIFKDIFADFTCIWTCFVRTIFLVLQRLKPEGYQDFHFEPKKQIHKHN